MGIVVNRTCLSLFFKWRVHNKIITIVTKITLQTCFYSLFWLQRRYKRNCFWNIDHLSAELVDFLSRRQACLIKQTNTNFGENGTANGPHSETQILCGTSHNPREGLWNTKIIKISLQINSIFTIFKNSRFFFYSNFLRVDFSFFRFKYLILIKKINIF